MRQATVRLPEISGECATALAGAAFTALSYTRRHRMDLGPSAAMLEAALERAVPGSIRQLDLLCAPRVAA